MTQTVPVPLWLFVLIVLFAAVTAASHLLFPSVRWYFRRRLEKAVERLNTRLTRPIEPFKLARRHDMIQRLIYDPQVSQEIVNHARANGVPENVASQKARAYAREIVPRFSAFTYFSFGIRVAKLLATSVYRIDTAQDNDATFAAVPREATVVFIMNHRSNMDYVLVTYLASRTSALSYAVGEWARVWPLSWLIRSMGAYFIRRRARGALYRKVLARYVQMATAGGVTQGIYPEGGLSLTGKLQRPKLGLLSYVVEGFDPQAERDIVFVPVALNYDRILEDRVLIAAGARGDRRFGARISVIVGFILRKLWQRMRGQDTRFGTAAVAFGTPLSLRAESPDIDIDALSDKLMARIEAAMPVPVVPLIAHALLAGGAPTQAELVEAVRGLLAVVPPANAVPQSETLAFEVNRALEGIAARDIVQVQDGRWNVTEKGAPLLLYYANSIAHFLDADAAAAKEISATAGS